jgi:hypothetical protein
MIEWTIFNLIYYPLLVIGILMTSYPIWFIIYKKIKHEPIT